jgi:hypothetical protein
MRKLQDMCASGNSEAALNLLASATGSQRGALIAHYTAVFERPFSPPSPSHELLLRLRLHSAVTTNYDVLLEQTDEGWLYNVATLGSERRAGRFLLKLYGNLSAPATVLLSQPELTEALGKTNVDALRQTMGEAPILFVGCSLQGLLTDLKTIGIPEVTALTGAVCNRFVITGVSGKSWEKDVEELSRKYGIQALVCTAEAIGTELPAFLDRLAQAVEGIPLAVDGAAAAAS